MEERLFSSCLAWCVKNNVCFLPCSVGKKENFYSVVLVSLKHPSLLGVSVKTIGTIKWRQHHNIRNINLWKGDTSVYSMFLQFFPVSVIFHSVRFCSCMRTSAVSSRSVLMHNRLISYLSNLFNVYFVCLPCLAVSWKNSESLQFVDYLQADVFFFSSVFVVVYCSSYMGCLY